MLLIIKYFDKKIKSPPQTPKTNFRERYNTTL